MLLVNNSPDDVRGLAMKRFIMYDEVCVCVCVIVLQTPVNASESRGGPQRTPDRRKYLQGYNEGFVCFNLISGTL